MSSTSLQQLKETGELLGLKGPELMSFVREQQTLEREEREKQRQDREKEDERLEKMRLLELERAREKEKERLFKIERATNLCENNFFES